MSGGSYDYAYYKVQDMADQLKNDPSELRRAFAEHLSLVATAMHDIEWVDSSDYGRDGDVNAINAVLENPEQKCIEILKGDAKELISKLERLISLNNSDELKPCLGSECSSRAGHVLWCEQHPNYPHDGPDDYYQKILDKESEVSE